MYSKAWKSDREASQERSIIGQRGQIGSMNRHQDSIRAAFFSKKDTIKFCAGQGRNRMDE